MYTTIFILVLMGTGFLLYHWWKTEQSGGAAQKAVEQARTMLANRDLLYQSVWGDFSVASLIDQELKGLPQQTRGILEALDQSLRKTCRLDKPQPQDPEDYSPRKVKVNDEQRAYFEARKHSGDTEGYATAEEVVSAMELRELARDAARYGDRAVRDAYLSFFRSILASLKKQLPRDAFAVREPSSLLLSSPSSTEFEPVLLSDLNLPLFQFDSAMRKHDPKLPSVRILGQPEERRPFKDTPLGVLSLLNVAPSISLASRFEHHWICAGTGHGKTQTLQYMISEDLPFVLRGERSVIVIDSKGSVGESDPKKRGMIDRLAHLKVFKDNPDRLVLIDPTDTEHPLALNLFDLAPGTSREKHQNSLVQSYRYMLGAILDAELTTKQGTPFNYAIRLMAHMPKATIVDFHKIFSSGVEDYWEHVVSMDAANPHDAEMGAQEFFSTQWNDAQYRETKREITRRIWDILQDPTFRRMLTAPENKLNLLAEMNAGKLILINTAKDFLKDEASAIFGRFFLAMIDQATQARRAEIPVFVYIDECHEYVDATIASLLALARERSIGLILAHQNVGKLPEGVYDALASNASIIMAGGNRHPSDVSTFSSIMRVDKSFIEDQPKFSFATYVKDLTPPPATFTVKPGVLEDMPKMSNEDFEAMRVDMRKRYARAPASAPAHAEPLDHDNTKAANW